MRHERLRASQTLAYEGGRQPPQTVPDRYISSNTRWGSGHGGRRREANVIRTKSWTCCSCGNRWRSPGAGGMKPICHFGRRLSVCGPSVKRLRGGAWGSVGEEAGGRRWRKAPSVFVGDGAPRWRAICLMVNDNCHRSGEAGPQKD